MQARVPRLIVLVAVVAAAADVDAQARPVEVTGLYPGGTTLTSPLTGITFRLPDGFRAEWDAAIGGLATLSNDGALGGVWGWSEGTVEEVAAEVGARLEAQEIYLEPRQEPVLSDRSMTGVFDATSSTGRGVLHAVIRVGPEGGVIAIAGLAQAPAEASARRFVESVDASLQWTRPGAASWRQQVTGSVLTWTGGGSDISTGSTTATGASSGTATLAFCGVGQYRYQESHETYVSIPGASASSTSGDEHTGGWWLVADLAGNPTLYLEATDGRTFSWRVEEASDGFMIDGYRYSVTGAC